MLGLVIPINNQGDEGVMIGWDEDGDGRWTILPDPMDPILAVQFLEDARANDGYVWYEHQPSGTVGVVSARTVWQGTMRDVSRQGMVASLPAENPVPLSGFADAADYTQERSNPAA